MTPTLLLVTLYIAALAIFCVVAQRLPILAREAQHRVSALDGLRGILATAVAVHHFAVTYYWHTTGLWQTTDSRVINNMGAVAVSLFFMITGYLFTRKIQHAAPDWGQLLASRLRRIMPMYLVSVSLIIAIAFYQSAGTLAPLGDTLRSLGHWLIFVGQPINGFADTLRINASVHWTLLYEAVFYLCLPLLFCLVHWRAAQRLRGRWMAERWTPERWKATQGPGLQVARLQVPGKALVFALVALACLWTEYHHHFSTRYMRLFLAGIAVALLEDWLKRRPFDYQSLRWTALAVVIVVISLLVKSYTKVQLVLLTVPFALFVLGNNLHGLLEHRGMKILGEASFSIYLLHGIVIYVLFSVWTVFDFAHSSLNGFAVYLIPVLLLTAFISVMTYWWVERPFIASRGDEHSERGNDSL